MYANCDFIKYHEHEKLYYTEFQIFRECFFLRLEMPGNVGVFEVVPMMSGHLVPVEEESLA